MSRPARRVPAAELQRLFNEGRYFERVQAGELLAVIERQNPPLAQNQQPPGTISQTIWYVDVDAGLTRIALVHQYLLPDGSIGASGRPDPKRLLIDGEILIAE